MSEAWQKHPTKPIWFTKSGMARYEGRKQPRKATRLDRRLVLETFVGSAPSPEHQVVSLNGDSDDARLENLTWMTRVEFMQLRHMHGTYVERPVEHINGVKHFECRKCGKWLPETEFYPLAKRHSRHGNPLSTCGRQSECRGCSTERRGQRRRVSEGKSPGRLEPQVEALCMIGDLDGDHSMDWASIGPRLKRARTARGLTRTHAAAAAGINPQTIEAWELGRNTPRPPKLAVVIAIYARTPPRRT